MASFSPSRLLLVAVASLVVVLSGWYGFSAVFHDQNLQAPRGTQSLVGAQVSEASSTDRGEEEGPDLRSQVALLRSDLAKVQRQLRQLAQSASQAQRSAKPSGAEEPADAVVLSEQELREQEADMIEAENQRSLARMAAGEAALQQESADGVWSIQAAEALREALANEALSGTTVQDINCRSTLCRLQVVHDNREQQALFEHDFSFKVGQLLPRMMTHSEEQTDGTISATIYLAREGNELPRSD
jgi:hypothetical protein